LSLVLDTDDGRRDRHQGVRPGWWDPADDLHPSRWRGTRRRGWTAGRSFSAARGSSAGRRIVVRRHGRGAAAAENSLPATRIDPFPDPAARRAHRPARRHPPRPSETRWWPRPTRSTVTTFCTPWWLQPLGCAAGAAEPAAHGRRRTIQARSDGAVPGAGTCSPRLAPAAHPARM